MEFFLDSSVQVEWSPKLIQHEVSHLFGAYDYGLESPNYHEQDHVTGERLAEGTYAVDITARDMAGNTAHQSLTFHIDMTPPGEVMLVPQVN